MLLSPFYRTVRGQGLLKLRARMRGGLVIGLVSVLLFAGAEIAVRGWRYLRGEDPRTRVERFYEQITEAVRLYRRHPFLNTAPREGARVEAFGKTAGFNSLGYRSPERPKEKPDGTVRIVCMGGSTTFDIAATGDRLTWPWLLEEILGGKGSPVEVWNAGFPGWTSMENLISLAGRELDLDPDLLILYQGINDLQPGAHSPFDPTYDAGHADEARIALGLELEPIRWVHRSALVEASRTLVIGAEDPWTRLKEVRSEGPRLGRLPAEAVQTFARNVRSILSLAKAHGARVVLVTQPLRVRESSREGDLAYLSGWLSGLAPGAAPRELERLNEVARSLGATESGVIGWDAAALPWTDAHFADPMHFSEAGSRLFAQRLAELIEPLVGPPARD